MTKYHINLDGKIYPCRATVHPCPYSSDRHSEDLSVLYHKAQQEYNEKHVSNEYLDYLEHGGLFPNYRILDNDIKNSNNPIEVITSQSEIALQHWDDGVMPTHLQNLKNEILPKASTLYNYGYFNDIEYLLPEDIRDEIFKNHNKYGKKRGILNNSAVNATEISRLINNIRIDKDSLKEYKKWKTSHYQEMSISEAEQYKKELEKTFNKYSQLLNTSKTLSNPVTFNTQNFDNFISSLTNASDTELFSMHDSLIETKKEIDLELSKVNYFADFDYPNISDEANQKIHEWCKLNRTKVDMYKINDAQHLAAEIEVVKELINRGHNLAPIYTEATEERNN